MRSLLGLAFTVLCLPVLAQFGEQQLVAGCQVCGDALVAFGDFDEDGLPDIVSLSEDHGELNVRLGGMTAAESRLKILFTNEDITPLSLGVGYVDDDPHLDIVVGISSNVSLQVYRGDGNGQFVAPYPIPSLFGNEELLFVDFNGDGLLDIITEKDTDELILATAVGDGSFVIAGTQPIDSGELDEYQLADIDGDGDQDVVATVGWPSDRILYFEHTADHQLTSQALLIQSDTHRFDEMEVADLDADQYDELIVYSNIDEYWGIVRRSGPGTDYSLTVVENTEHSLHNFIGLDADSDGDTDLLVESTTPFPQTLRRTRLYTYQDGAFGNPETVLIQAAASREFIAVDADADGLMDLYQLSFDPIERLLLADGNGSYAPVVISGFPVHGANIVQGVDFDDDEDTDILLTNIFSTQSLLLFQRDSSGTFPDTLDYSDALRSSDMGMDFLGIADVDLDGDPDFLPDNRTATRLKWSENTGNRAFIHHDIDSTTTTARSNFADLDNDGLVDIINSGAPDGYAWYRNLGNGVFDNAQLLLSYRVNPLVTDYDFTGDGRIDIIYHHMDSVLLLRNEPGGFVPQFLFYDIESVEELTHADVDGDGDQDLIYKRDVPSSAEIYWVENINATEYAAPSILTSHVSEISNIQAHDFDLDGDMDIFAQYGSVFNAHTGVTLIENLGSGNFAAFNDLTRTRMSTRTYGLFDVTGDGLTDIIQGDENRLLLFNNDVAPPTLRGLVFEDLNDNGSLDPDESGIPNVAVDLQPGDLRSFTGADGTFQLRADPGAYTLAVDGTSSRCYDPSENSSPYDLQLPQMGGQTYLFPMNYIPSPSVLEPTMVAAFNRCNSIVPFWVTVSNLGCTVATDVLYGIVADPMVSYYQFALAPTYVVDDTLWWEASELAPEASTFVPLHFQMPGTDAIGESLRYTVLVGQLNAAGVPVVNASRAYTEEVLCAYDPNDKLVQPSYPDYPANYFLTEDYLQYTVRFQNTGNDTAFTVVVRDTLDSHLDPSTFEPLGSSHPMRTSINRDNGAITFRFEQILLVDSLTNEPLSHGYLQYRVKPLQDLPEETEIHNTAFIYFDLNPPIVTNTVLNTAVSRYLVDADIQHACNDASGAITVAFPYFDGVVFEWEDGTVATTRSNLPAGNYPLRVIDARNADLLVDTILQVANSGTITAETFVTPVSDTGQSDGSIILQASGGVEPYQYQWAHDPTNVSVEAIDLSTGTYTVTITDANDCFLIISTTVGLPTGTSVPVDLFQVFLSPNPTREVSTVSAFAQHSTVWQLRLHNGLGSELYTFRTQQARRSFQHELPALPTGTYFVTLNTGNGSKRTVLLIVAQ